MRFVRYIVWSQLVCMYFLFGVRYLGDGPADRCESLHHGTAVSLK